MTAVKIDHAAHLRKINQFLSFLRDSLDQNTFVKLVLSKYQGAEPGLVRITVKPVVIKGDKQLSFIRHYREQDVIGNVSTEGGIEDVERLVGDTFKAAHLLMADEDIHIEFTQKGECRLSRGKSAHKDVPTGEHDREKHRIIDHRRPFLRELGVTSASDRVYPSMSRKWKQINKFMEFFDHAVKATGFDSKRAIDVVDFGCGKGYLTFAVHDYLTGTLGMKANVAGVELRENLVRFCNDTAKRLDCTGLSFRQGDIGSYTPARIDVLIALHACDTATDLAIHMGISAGAGIIMCAPCCHKQIRPQMKSPELLKPLLRFGVHMAQEADMATDALRALLLESRGYDVSIFEFISLEHTEKNKMILGIRNRSGIINPGKILEQVRAIKEFYGIEEHKLEMLMAGKGEDKGQRELQY